MSAPTDVTENPGSEVRYLLRRAEVSERASTEEEEEARILLVSAILHGSCESAAGQRPTTCSCPSAEKRRITKAVTARSPANKPLT